MTTSYGYNNFGELSSDTAKVNGNTLFEHSYTYDKVGRILTRRESVQNTTADYTYTYDNAGRLTDVSKNNTTVSHYEYDANGNRLSRTASGVSESGTYDDQDRLLTYGNLSFTYTANGELKTKTDSTTGQTTQYKYDVFGNLLQVILPDGKVIEYVIDGNDRRIAKKVNGQLVSGFLYEDDLSPVAELDGSNRVVSRFVYGTRVNVPDYIERGGKTYRIVTDHLGSVRLVVDTSDGTIAQKIDYDEFGRMLSDSNAGFQPFGFAGGLYEPLTGLVRFGARDYDPTAGRWTAKDPIGFEGGMNWFGYVANNPINQIDPSGLIFGVDDVVYLETAYWTAVAVSALGAYWLAKNGLNHGTKDFPPLRPGRDIPYQGPNFGNPRNPLDPRLKPKLPWQVYPLMLLREGVKFFCKYNPDAEICESDPEHSDNLQNRKPCDHQDKSWPIFTIKPAPPYLDRA